MGARREDVLSELVRWSRSEGRHASRAATCLVRPANLRYVTRTTADRTMTPDLVGHVGDPALLDSAPGRPATDVLGALDAGRRQFATPTAPKRTLTVFTDGLANAGCGDLRGRSCRSSSSPTPAPPRPRSSSDTPTPAGPTPTTRR